MSENDNRAVGRPDETTGENGELTPQSERLQQPGAGARVTGVHGVGAPDVTDHDVPARDRGDDDSDLPIDNGAGS